MIIEEMIQHRRQEIEQLFGFIQARIETNEVKFELFEELENLLKTELQIFLPEYLPLFQRHAQRYLISILDYCSNNKKLLTTLNLATLNRNYFLQQKHKLNDTDLYPFQSKFDELNYIYFLKELELEVKLSSNLPLKDQQSMFYSKFEKLALKQDLVLDKICCNKFFYQFYPINLRLQAQKVEIKIFNHVSKDQIVTKGLNETHTPLLAKPNKAIDLNNPENERLLLLDILQLLNGYGGIIIAGCKTINEFLNVKNNFQPFQFDSYLRDIHLVIGQPFCQTKQQQFTQGIAELIKRIDPPIQIDVNAKINFVPIKQTPFQLNYGLNKMEFPSKQFAQKCLHLIVIKIKPTQFCQRYMQKIATIDSSTGTSYDSDNEDGQNLNVKSMYNQQLINNLSLEEIEEQSWMVKPKRNYFQGHKCQMP